MSLVFVVTHWLLCAVALLMVSYLYAGVRVRSFGAALAAALVIGLLNALLSPFLHALALPVTALTYGLFAFVVNAFLFWLAGLMLSGFAVRDFVAALVGSLLYSILGVGVNYATGFIFGR